MKKIIEIRRFDGEDRIFIDNNLFDWRIDDESLDKINKITDKQELMNVHQNIKEYLLNSLEAYLDRPITIRQIYEAIKTGHIEV
jgi:hypothetical protein